MKSGENPFVAWLERLRDENDRAALAKLRRGLGKQMGTPEMYPFVVPFMPDNRRGREHYFLIASLFAAHPDPAPPERSMGSVFKAIKGQMESESIEKRFVQLLSADIEDVGKYLRHAVSLARSKGVAVNYHRLLSDLRYWEHRDRFVQLQWARDFWGFEKQEPSKRKKGEN